jgi:allophanate hydrolase subunit 1
MSSVIAYWILIGVFYGAFNRIVFNNYKYKITKKFPMSEEMAKDLERVSKHQTNLTEEFIIAVVSVVIWPVMVLGDVMLILTAPRGSK